MTVNQDAFKNWAETDKDRLKEVVRLGELQIQQQVLTAQSLDQRATGIAALTVAGVVAISIFSLSELSKQNNLTVLYFAVPIALIWFVSACFAIQTLMPKDWGSAGTWPGNGLK